MRSFRLVKLVCLIALVLAGPSTILAQPPAEAPADAPIEAPVLGPMDAPVAPPVEAPIHAPVEAPIQTPTQPPMQPVDLYCWEGYNGSEALCTEKEASDGFVKRAWLCGSNSLCSMMVSHPEFYTDPKCCTTNNCNGVDLDGANSTALLPISIMFILCFSLISTIINL